VYAAQSASTLVTPLLPTIPLEPAHSPGWRIFAAAAAQFGAISVPTSSPETSKAASLRKLPKFPSGTCGSQNLIQNNGPVSVTAGFGSRSPSALTSVSGHSGPALDLYASTGLPFGANYLHNNGGRRPRSAAIIRVDGNSEAFLRGGSVSQNIGPAILACELQCDFNGVTFSSNTGGVIACDSSAYMVADGGAHHRPGVSCTPHFA
jgi:hypothetical protein